MKWLPTGDDSAWRKVRGGLGMIRCALWLLTLVFLAVCGQGVWIAFDTERAMSSEPGLLKQADWPLWKEVLVGYVGLFSIPAILLLLIGRLRCGGAPAASHARALAYGAAFFTLVAILGAAAFVGLRFFDLAGKLKVPLPPGDDSSIVIESHLGPKLNLIVPAPAQLTALCVAIAAFALAELLTLLFIGQIGWPLNRPQLQKSVAGFLTYATILPAGVLIGMQFYSVISNIRRAWNETGAPLGVEGDDTAQRVLIWGVILLAAGVMLFLRYASVAGQARKAIRKLLAGEA
jgi:hypothetical protein